MAKKKEVKLYEVELLNTPASGAKKTMWRGGRQFEVKVAQVLELTEEEAEVYANDNRFSLSETDGSKVEADESEASSDSESDAQDGDSESSEEESSDESEDSEDSSSDEAEEASDDSTESSDSDEEEAPEEVTEAPTVDELVKNNTREELNALAVEANVENPEQYETKPEVAQAIVEAEARNAESEATS